MSLPDDVAAALEATFSGPVRAEPMTGGRSGAQLFALETDEGRFVARKIAGHNEDKAERELACMAVAAELGIAPRIVYGQNGVLIMEWLEGRPISRGTPRDEDPLGRLAAVLRRLHQGPPFPAGPSLPSMFGQLAEGLRQKGHAPPPADLVATVTRVCQEVESFGVLAPCHRDLNPTNILATTSEVRLVDWEVAGMSDPFLDLAQVGIWICRDDAERASLLPRYLEREPDSREERRMALQRVLALSFYAASFCFVCALQNRQVQAEPLRLETVFAGGPPFEPERMAAALLHESARAAQAL